MIVLPETTEDIVVRLLRLANTKLPSDIGWALEAGAGWETDQIAYSQLGAIMDNAKKAEFLGKPMCQDTGIPVFYVRGRFDSSIVGDIERAVKRATAEIPLRPNLVDPLTRENTGDNTGFGAPFIHFIPTDDDFLEITVLPKGAGSENMTRLAMLNPADGIEGVMKFIVDAVLDAGGRPCPPSIVGVGIGGTMEMAAFLAKKALLREIGKSSEDERYAELEKEILEKINSSGVGPQGLGGNVTSLAVNILHHPCHLASLPVAVNLNCHAARHAEVTI